MGSKKVNDSMARGFAGLILSSQMGCIVLDEEHCLANGGDLACSGQHCMLETGKTAKIKTDELGCKDRPGESRHHFHLKYGLPVAVKMTEADRNLDSIDGILIALREEHGVEASCPLDSPELQGEYDEVVLRHSEVYIVRARMEKQGRARTAPAKITSEEMESIEDYNEAVDTWLKACLEKAASEM